jgi:hypothetical protein
MNLLQKSDFCVFSAGIDKKYIYTSQEKPHKIFLFSNFSTIEYKENMCACSAPVSKTKERIYIIAAGMNVEMHPMYHPPAPPVFG